MAMLCRIEFINEWILTKNTKNIANNMYEYGMEEKILLVTVESNQKTYKMGRFFGNLNLFVETPL